MSDFDIEFGEVEEAKPKVHLRPDRNKHFACVPYDQPESSDLPIFVDIDVMRDMEAHALSDTSVELGGVLLGGQHEDENGRPFVVVTDSLRAEHYESTKGSFKFTHETWEEITRQRELFPEELAMVGWYHTHPDWGVFLSGMDMFICDNFFNRPLDVALVIDPCRQDRGMFMWTGNPAERVRRTGGFYLIGSRFREDELNYFSTQLGSEFNMADPRYGGGPGGFGAPVVNVTRESNQWQMIAVLGMLTMQFLLIALLYWRTVEPTLNPPVAEVDAQRVEEREAELELREQALSGKEAFLNRFYAGDAPGTSQQLVGENLELQQNNRNLQDTVSGLSVKLDLQADAMDKLKEDLAIRTEDFESAQSIARKRSEQLDEKDEEIKELHKRLAKYDGSKQGDDAAGEGIEFWGVSLWIWISGGVAVVIGVVAAALFSMQKDTESLPPKDDGYGENDDESSG